MKKIIPILAILLFATISFAQDVKKDDWFRVQSDDGEFSIEVPAKYGYFYDKDGFWINKDSDNNYALEKMSMVNAYINDTLLSFECYKAPKDVLDIFEDRDDKSAKWNKESKSSTEIKKDTYKIKQKIFTTDKYQTIRQYFSSKSFIYILTVSSRKGETKTMRRFLDSLVFKPDTKDGQIKDIIAFSKLKPFLIEFIETKDAPASDKNDVTLQKTKDADGIKKMMILIMPNPSYLSNARNFHEQGVIRFKVVFSEQGIISKIIILKSLKYGLLRQAIFAALRLKYLPEEKDDKPISVTKTIEYRFSLG